MEPKAGPPARIDITSGGTQRAFANMELAQPIRLSVRDANGRALPDARVTFSVTRGGGTLTGSTVVLSDVFGSVTAPGWRLGRSAVTQTMRAAVGDITAEVSATVASDFHIAVRLFGEAMTAANQDAFAAGVARVRGIITGDLPAVNAVNSGIDLAACGISGQPPLDELIDDVLIFAAVQNIDGPGNILAQAGPCLVRAGNSPMTAVGVMAFDASDLERFLQGAAFEEVVTHEIIHVLGFGTLWTDRGLVRDTATPDPRYTGLQGHHGCLTAGWALSCAVDIPVEAGGGRGTALSHWRETTFGNELLTGYYSAGGNVLSVMTVGSLEDLGFVVNRAAADAGLPAASIRGATLTAPSQREWERQRRPVGSVTPDGRLRRLPDTLER